MKIKLALSTGKEIELTEEELNEIRGSKDYTYYPYPIYPTYPINPWTHPYVTYNNKTVPDAYISFCKMEN